MRLKFFQAEGEEKLVVELTLKPNMMLLHKNRHCEERDSFTCHCEGKARSNLSYNDRFGTGSAILMRLLRCARNDKKDILQQRQD